ncbi:MAG: DUF2231 domain-containing protein [FCB group bacterium]|nr:DUF2231 domain-containing protein [FCB group bacterium]
MLIEDIHPPVIHFPIALLSSAIFFDTLALLFKKDRFQLVGTANLILGLFFALLAIITGFIADRLVGHMEEPFPVFKTHGSMQILTVALFFGIAFWRWRLKGRLPTGPLKQGLYLAYGTIAVVSLFYGSYLGTVLAGR